MSSNKELMATIDEKLNKLDVKDLEEVAGAGETGVRYEVRDSNGNLIGYADTKEELLAIMEIIRNDPSYMWKGRIV